MQDQLHCAAVCWTSMYCEIQAGGAVDAFVFQNHHSPDPWTCPGTLGISFGRQSRMSAHFPGRSLEICSTSLSPRPDRHCMDEGTSAPIRTVCLYHTYQNYVLVFGKSLSHLNSAPYCVCRLQSYQDIVKCHFTRRD